MLTENTTKKYYRISWSSTHLGALRGNAVGRQDIRGVLVEDPLWLRLLDVGWEGPLQLGEDGIHIQVQICPRLQRLAQLNAPTARIAGLLIQHNRGCLQPTRA